MKAGEADEPQLPEFPSQTPDIALFLPPDMPSDALRRLNACVRRIQEGFQVRCVWNARTSTNDGGGDAEFLTLPPATASELRAIDDIKVGKRHRQDLGDIETLAQSIAATGLLHPITVDATGNLLAGARRLAACKQLVASRKRNQR